MGDKMFYGGNAGWRPAFVSAKRPNGYRIRIAVYASGDTPSITQPVFPCIDPAAPLTMEVNENENAGAVVGQTTAADPDNDSVTYSVSGADAAGFNRVFAMNASLRRDNREVRRVSQLRGKAFLLHHGQRDRWRGRLRQRGKPGPDRRFSLRHDSRQERRRGGNHHP